MGDAWICWEEQGGPVTGAEFMRGNSRRLGLQGCKGACCVLQGLNGTMALTLSETTSH